MNTFFSKGYQYVGGAAVGWFIFASVLGFATYQLRESWWILVPIVAGLSVIFGFVYWLVCIEHANTLTRIASELGQGWVARFALGIVLGAGVGYVLEPRLAGARTLLVTGLGIILLLGVTAPHLDRWFKQLSGVKSSFFELQLATSTSARHAVAVSEISVGISNREALTGLANYDNEIRQDINFMRFFAIPELQHQKANSSGQHLGETQKKLDLMLRQVNDADRLLPVFERLVSPIAACIQDAMKKKGLHIESVRTRVRPIAELLQAILLQQDKPGIDVESAQRRDQFWSLVRTLPENEEIKPFLASEEVERDVRDGPGQSRKETKNCGQYPADYVKNFNWSPGITEFADMPYLFSAGAYLLNFMGYNDTSALVLRHRKPEFMDNVFLNNAGKLIYFQGASVEFSVPFFEKMRDAARDNQTVIRNVESRCNIGPCDHKDVTLRLAKELAKRERYLEVRAMNNLTYVVAEDLARGVKSAESFRTIAEDHAEKIYQAVRKGEFAEPKDYDRKNYYLDTYAYMGLVVESRRPVPDIERFRALIRIFESVVEHHERRIEQMMREGRPVATVDLTDVRIARGHLASAHELAGE